MSFVGLLSILSAAAIAGLAHAPHGTLARAETARGVDLLARAVEVYLDIETVFAASMAEALNGGNLELIHTRAHSKIPGLTDDVVALADDNIGFAFAPALEIDAYLPGANPLALDNRIRRHIEILNIYAIAALATAAAPAVPIRRHRFWRNVHQ
ncbi:MAG: hypothetical protein ACXW6T_21405 [Candidatus Binatia bacterium]